MRAGKKCMLVVLNIFGGKGDGGGSDSKIMCIHYNQYAKRISLIDKQTYLAKAALKGSIKA